MIHLHTEGSQLMFLSHMDVSLSPSLSQNQKTKKSQNKYKGKEMKGISFATLRIIKVALAGVAQWIECRPANQRVTCSIPSQGTCLGCGPGSQGGGGMKSNHTLMFVFLFLPPSPLSKNK